MATYKLTYFDFHGGRGEDCRLALHLAGADWEDDRLAGAKWMERKPSTPFGGLPVLHVEGKGDVAQSNAILAYLGRTFGLHPSDPFDQARHEALLNAVEDLRAQVTPTLRIKDEDEKKAAREALASGAIPTWGDRIEATLGDGPFIGGDEIGVADLKLFVLVKWFAGGGVDHVPADIFAKNEKLTRLYEAVKSHPKVVEYYAKFDDA